MNKIPTCTLPLRAPSAPQPLPPNPRPPPPHGAQDSQDPNPLIRALAVRTMGCIRVDKITEYLCDPLLKTLKDEDPYVRKTAAVCVAKLYDINPDLVEERGFLDILRDLIGDSNPMVVANAVAALAEIADASGRPEVFQITSHTLVKLLAALNECTEWGQVFILDALTGYSPRDAHDAETIVERVTPRLQHANCAVVLSAVKVLLRQVPHLGSEEAVKALKKKMAPPLVTLLSAEPEIQCAGPNAPTRTPNPRPPCQAATKPAPGTWRCATSTW